MSFRSLKQWSVHGQIRRPGHRPRPRTHEFWQQPAAQIQRATAKQPERIRVGDHDPVQCLRPVGKAALITIVSGQEIVTSGSPARRESYRLMVTGETWLAVPTGAGVVEPALIRERSSPGAKIVKKPDDLVPRGDAQQVDLAAFHA